MKSTESKDEIYQEFYNLVNMQSQELQDWLETEESKAVGAKPAGDGESVGHRSGRRIVEIKRTNKDELSTSDYDHMTKVIGYIKRHLAQRPDGDISSTDWRYSLKNWGHEPLES